MGRQSQFWPTSPFSIHSLVVFSSFSLCVFYFLLLDANKMGLFVLFDFTESHYTKLSIGVIDISEFDGRDSLRFAEYCIVAITLALGQARCVRPTISGSSVCLTLRNKRAWSGIADGRQARAGYFVQGVRRPGALRSSSPASDAAAAAAAATTG